MQLRPLLRPLLADLRPRGAGWASVSLVASMRRVSLGLIAAWQVVMILAAAVSLGGSAWALMCGHALLALLAAGAVSRLPRVPVWPLALAMAVLGLLDYVHSGDLDSVLVFAACWQINFASCALGLTLLHPSVTPVVMLMAGTVGAALRVALPGWGLDLPVTILITQTAIVLALRYGLPPLIALARRTDHEERLSAVALERAEVARRTSLRVAEETRVLHDTAVNTLGAIANGGAGTSDPERVRRQCTADLVALRALRRDRAAPERTGAVLLDALAASWIPVHREGLDDAQVERAVAGEDPGTVTAFAGAVREALTNAAKHSGAARVDVTVTRDDDGLAVEVRDTGAGFDPEGVRTRGLRHSVRERAEAMGFAARLETAPGAGTRVVLALPLGTEAPVSGSESDSPARVEETIRALLHRAALLWAVGVTAVGVVLTVTNRANYAVSAVLMAGVMVGSWTWARFARSGWSTAWLVPFLVVAPSLVFVCAAATTDFGDTNALHWQALAPTAPFVLLLARRGQRRASAVAALVWVGTALGITLLGLPSTADALAIVAVAAAVGLGFGVVWLQFQSAVAKLCTESAAAAHRVHRANVETSAARAAQRTYLRWIDTGLEPAIQLLQGIVDGTRDAGRRDTRLACGIEERYLRQVIQVGPELMHLGSSVFPAMRLAHDRGIELTLRLGDRDASDRTVAEDIAGELIALIHAASAADRISASLFPVSAGLQLTLVRVPGPRSPEQAPADRVSASGSITTAQILFPWAPEGGDPAPGSRGRVPVVSASG